MKTFVLTAVTALIVICANAQAQYTFIFLHKNPDAETLAEKEAEKLMEGHMANMEKLAREGRLLAAGPFGGGGGMWIMNTSDREQIRQWISTDPGIQANRWKVEMLAYSPRYGGVCPVGEPYEMTSYTLVRFLPMVDKTTVPEYGEILRRHDAFLATLRDGGNLITEASFGASEGGIIIMKGEVTMDAFAADPGVKAGLLETDIKKLYIAKGSFCEK